MAAPPLTLTERVSRLENRAHIVAEIPFQPVLGAGNAVLFQQRPPTAEYELVNNLAALKILHGGLYLFTLQACLDLGASSVGRGYLRISTAGGAVRECAHFFQQSPPRQASPANPYQWIAISTSGVAHLNEGDEVQFILPFENTINTTAIPSCITRLTITQL